MIRALLAAGALALVAAAPAGAARWAVGVAEGASLDQVAAEVERVSGATAERSLEELGAVVVETRAPARLRALPGVAYVERIDVGRRLAFVPNDPLASRSNGVVSRSRSRSSAALVQPLRHSAPALTSNSGQGATSTVPRPDSRIPHCSEQ